MYRLAIGLALLSAILFGAATPASKFLLSTLSPFQLAGLLYLGAALAVAPSALKNASALTSLLNDRANALKLIGAVVFGGILGPLCLLLGLVQAEAASVALWLNLELVVTAVLGVILFRDHLSKQVWLGVFLAFGAAILLSWSQGVAGFMAGILVLLACIFWGLDNHLTALIDGISPSQSTFFKGAVAGLVNLSLGLTFATWEPDIFVVLSALLVGAFSYGVSIVLYIRSAQALGATRSQVFFSSAPFFGVLLSVLVLGEEVESGHWLAGGLFAMSIMLIMRESHLHRHVHEPQVHTHSHRHDDGHHNHVHPGLPAFVRHSHKHEHEPMEHSHVHFPDLHHRHSHAAKESDKNSP